MTKLTFAPALFAAALLFTAIAAPASARSAGPTPQNASHAKPQHVEKAPPAYEAARAAFLRSLAQEDGKPGAKRPMNTKMAPVACTGEGGMTTCCGPCGCCTWSGFGDGAHCASNC
jgi:hypothetical protein